MAFVHERFSYPARACDGQEHTPPLSPTEAAIIHECDLPAGHTTRHMCGECGRFFG